MLGVRAYLWSIEINPSINGPQTSVLPKLIQPFFRMISIQVEFRTLSIRTRFSEWITEHLVKQQCSFPPMKYFIREANTLCKSYRALILEKLAYTFTVDRQAFNISSSFSHVLRAHIITSFNWLLTILSNSSREISTMLPFVRRPFQSNEWGQNKQAIEIVRGWDFVYCSPRCRLQVRWFKKQKKGKAYCRRSKHVNR